MRTLRDFDDIITPSEKDLLASMDMDLWGNYESMGEDNDGNAVYHTYLKEGAYGIMGNYESGWIVVHAKDGVPYEPHKPFDSVLLALHKAEELAEKDGE